MATPFEQNPSGTCVNCGQPLLGRFCVACGEKRPEPEDLSWKHVCTHAVEAFTHADGKIFRTVRVLLAAPGVLTADYLRGKRRPYIAPLPLFLICSLVFFLLQPLIGFNGLTTPLRSHVNDQPYRSWIRPLVDRKIAATHVTFEAYAVEFDHYIAVEARALTLVLVPLFLAPLVLMLIWSHRRLVDHLTFSLHFCAWFLLFQLIFLSVARIAILPMSDAYYRAHWETVDEAMTVLSIGMEAVYLYFAVRVVFQESKGAALVKAGTLACAMLPVIFAYRFFLFFVAYWRT